MSFDFVAPFYQILERIVFGSKLQTARMAFVPEITRRQRVLVVGEGDGRFLAEFVEFWPESEIVCVEASRRMIERARKRTVGHRIRVDVSSSNFPRLERNPNTGEPIGRHSRMEVAEQTVFGGEIVLPVIAS